MPATTRKQTHLTIEYEVYRMFGSNSGTAVTDLDQLEVGQLVEIHKVNGSTQEARVISTSGDEIQFQVGDNYHKDELREHIRVMQDSDEVPETGVIILEED